MSRRHREAMLVVDLEKDYIWLRGQAVKTSPFHGGNTGSIPVGVSFWTFSSVG